MSAGNLAIVITPNVVSENLNNINKPKMAYSRDAYIRETRERLERD